MEFDFIKGAALALSVNGTALGGVYKLKILKKRDVEYYYEFLTDKPVAENASEKYVIELYMRASDEDLFDGELTSFELSENGRRVVFEGCALIKDETSAEGSGFVERHIELEAKERSVADERDFECAC